MEKTAEIATKTGRQVLQVRIAAAPDEAALQLRAMIAENGWPTEPRNLDRYIAVTGSTDLLLTYLEGQEAELESDWARLTAEPEVHITELLWFEVIEGHALGRTKTGGIRMY